MRSQLYYLNRSWDCDKCSSVNQCLGKSISKEQKSTTANHNNNNNHSLYKVNDKIYKLESKFNSLFIIKSGIVKLQTITESGDKLIKGFYFSGDLIGIESIGNQYYVNDAIALQNTSVCSIPYSKFKSLIHSSPDLFDKFSERMAAEINISDVRLTNVYSTKNVEGRALEFLKFLARKMGTESNEDCISLTLPMSKSDIAIYLGIRPESLSRALEKLKKKGIIDCLKSKIFIRKINLSYDESLMQR